MEITDIEINSIENTIISSIIEVLSFSGKNRFRVYKRELYDPVELLFIDIQFYRSNSNKLYIEYKLSDNLYKIANMSNDRYQYINSLIENNIPLHTRSQYGEVITPSTKNDDNCNKSNILTPYVIGYFDSINGKNNLFLSDKEEILKSIKNSYTDPVENNRNLAFDQDKFNKFKDLVNSINIKYLKLDNTSLSSDEFKEYLNDYRDIYSTYYNSDNDKFLEELLNLYEKYNINTYDENIYEDMYKEYIELFNSTFNERDFIKDKLDFYKSYYTVTAGK